MVGVRLTDLVGKVQFAREHRLGLQ